MSIVAGAAVAQDATEIMKKSHMAYYYAADDGVADVTMTIVDKKGKERLREFTMIRLDEVDGGNQKYYTYFKKPSDVSRLTFMVHKNPDGNDARWIYVPSVDLIKPSNPSRPMTRTPALSARISATKMFPGVTGLWIITP